MAHSDDRLINFADLHGLSYTVGGPMYNAKKIRDPNGRPASFILALDGRVLLAGGRECTVGNIVAYLPNSLHNIANESMWFGLVVEVNRPGCDAIRIQRLMSGRFLHSLAGNVMNGPINRLQLWEELKDAEVHAQADEQFLSGRLEYLSRRRICVVVTMGEFRTLNFNNTMMVLCSYNGSVVNMLERD